MLMDNNFHGEGEEDILSRKKTKHSNSGIY